MAEYNLYDNKRYILDGLGGLAQEDNGKYAIWHNLDYQNPNSYKILLEEYQLDPLIVDALCDEDTRPRFVCYDTGILLILRAINLNPGSNPEDMISLRFWIDENKIISLQHRNLKSIKKIADALENKVGPKTPIQCFLTFANAIADVIVKTTNDLTDRTDDIEEEIIDIQDMDDLKIRGEINDLRHEIIALRRYIAPMREVFQNLQLEKNPLITQKAKIRLKEVANDIVKSLEDLDYCREHISFYHEELQGRISINMSRIMYIISIFTAIFLPLTLITGLLGINVQGIPLADNEHAFWIVCALMLVISLILVYFMKKKRWM